MPKWHAVTHRPLARLPVNVWPIKNVSAECADQAVPGIINYQILFPTIYLITLLD